MDDFVARLAALKDEELKVQGEIASLTAEKQELIKDYATNRSRIRAVNEKISARQLEATRSAA